MTNQTKTTKYIFVHIIRKEAGEYHSALVKHLVTEFNVYPLYEVYPPHLTLKRPFEFTQDQMVEVYKTMDTFVQNQTLSNYKLSGVSNFKDRVIYLDVQESPQMVKTVQDFLDALKQVPNMSFEAFDDSKDFHATLVMHAHKPFNYTEIRNYLDHKNIKSFDLQFDNIALLKKTDDKKWKIEKVWEIK